MAWASSPTQVSPRPSGRSSRTMSACTALTSWYSSTSTASNRPRRAGSRISQRRPPQQQQVVEVDQAVGSLMDPVGAEQAGELTGEVTAPGKAARHDVSDGGLSVHAAGVDVG